MRARCPELQQECVLFIAGVYCSKTSLLSAPRAAPSPPLSLSPSLSWEEKLYPQLDLKIFPAVCHHVRGHCPAIPRGVGHKYADTETKQNIKIRVETTSGGLRGGTRVTHRSLGRSKRKQIMFHWLERGCTPEGNNK